MKYVAEDDIDKLPGRQLKQQDRFSFRCHPGLACFNRCCRNLNLFLYPYDVLRLRRQLGVSSDEFIERYVHVVLREGNFFPDVLLRMAENSQQTCPFLTDAGCRVYPDRPDACRTFPVELGRRYDSRNSAGTPVYFFRPPDFCLGQFEPDTWTTATWIADQQAEAFHEMTRRWSEVKRLFQQDPWGPEGPGGAAAKMAFMATYNIDQFRHFVFDSSFLKRYKVKQTVLKKIRSQDEALLTFGFEWVKLFVWKLPSKTIKPR